MAFMHGNAYIGFVLVEGGAPFCVFGHGKHIYAVIPHFHTQCRAEPEGVESSDVVYDSCVKLLGIAKQTVWSDAALL